MNFAPAQSDSDDHLAALSSDAEQRAALESPASVGWTQSKTIRLVTAEAPLGLELGSQLGPVDVEYETYGILSDGKDNVVFVAHALSGDAHAAGWDTNAQETGRQWRTRKPGWWDAMIGPGKAIDTERFFVICPNVLGSCYGNDRAILHQSNFRLALRSSFSQGHHRGLGRTPRAAARYTRHRPPVRRGGRFGGRPAGAGDGPAFSREDGAHHHHGGRCAAFGPRIVFQCRGPHMHSQ